jgi:hypothetical protein
MRDLLAQREALSLAGARVPRRYRLSDTSGLPRFVIVGVWAGKVQVRNGRVRITDKADPKLRALDDTDRLEFINRVRGGAKPPARDRTLPIHPTPKAK